MKRVLLIGRGPLPTDEEPQLGFSQLRTAAFYMALQRAGHEVRLLLLVPEASTPSPPPAWSGIVPITEEGPGWIEHARSIKDGAEIIVSAGPYNPGRLATSIVEDEPLWVDVPGDPLSELQALALASPSPLTEAQIAAAHSGALQVLTRADALSVISEPQRHATWGQLGLLGRLLTPDGTPTTHVLPITHDWTIPGAPPRAPGPGEDTVVALSGAFNPWFDADGLMTALDVALQARKDLKIICTGGGVPGFFESSFERFSKWAEQYPSRVHLYGWVPHEEMASKLCTAHAGLSLDAPGVEPALGSRTRLLLFAHMGLQCLSTVRCELARAWCDDNALLAMPHGDPEQVGHQLATLRIDVEMAARAKSLAIQNFNNETVMEPLLNWCAAPRRTQATAAPMALIAAQLDANRDELARIYGSPTWQALNRVHAFGTAALNRIKDRSE